MYTDLGLGIIFSLYVLLKMAVDSVDKKRFTALESQVASLQERDTKREENAKKRLENMPHLVALLKQSFKLHAEANRLVDISFADHQEKVYEHIDKLEQNARIERKIVETKEAINKLETEIAAEEAPQPLTPEQLEKWVRERFDSEIDIYISESEEVFKALTTRINQHFLGEKK